MPFGFGNVALESDDPFWVLISGLTAGIVVVGPSDLASESAELEVELQLSLTLSLSFSKAESDRDESGM